MSSTEPLLHAPAGPSQVVAYTGTAGTISNALPPSCRRVWVFCTSIAYVKISSGGTAAVATDFPVPASVPVIFPVDNNDGLIKVSAIQSAAGGNLHVVPVSY